MYIFVCIALKDLLMLDNIFDIEALRRQLYTVTQLMPSFCSYFLQWP